MQTTALVKAIDDAIGADVPEHLGVAVSGGGDSIALLHGLKAWGRAKALCVAVVDHGLRDGSAEEARFVQSLASDLGLPASVLNWTGWDGTGNLQDQARRARYALLADWATQNGLDAVALGHTAQDQAETFLMRLVRRAGLDGLSAMPVRRQMGGVQFLRPLLAVSRADLRLFLRDQGHAWVDDPSNDMVEFERVRVRSTLPALAEIGVTADAIADVASQLADAQRVLAQVTAEAFSRVGREEYGDVILSREGIAALDPEVQRRLLAGAFTWVAAAAYGPRRESLANAAQAIAVGRDTTLHGCRVLIGSKDLRICRELAAVQDLSTPAGEVWDNRWVATGPANSAEFTIRALGEDGIRDCPEWRASGRPRGAVLSSPAIWQGTRLIAAPQAGLAQDWRVLPAPDRPDFKTSLLSR